MTLRTLDGMDVLRPVEFAEALAWLQGLIGREVSVLVNHHGHFFGCGLQGTLSRVETLPPDNSAIRIVVGGGEGLFLDPEEVAAFLGAVEGETGWLELRTAFGPLVTVELAGSSSD